MFLIIRYLYENIKEFDAKYHDTRSDNLPILGSPLQMFSLVTAYYVFVKYIGPNLMRNRKPFELKGLMLVYNACQVVFNAYLAFSGVYYFWTDEKYSDWSCVRSYRDNSTIGQIELKLSYMYFMLKIADFLDTIFFVLRKRFRQITFLHVYHHVLVSLGAYFYARYLPAGHSAFVGFFNTIVHTIMYFYYFISALRPELKSSLWWKKHITQVQILQFIALIVQYVRPLLRKNCQYPKIPAFFVILQNVIMVVLFSDFYSKTYLRKKQSTNSKVESVSHIN